MFKLALNAGHALTTSGKEFLASLDTKVTKEWWVNNRLCNYIAQELQGYDVEILRTDDTTGKLDIPLIERTNRANTWGSNLLLDIHHNAGAKGTSAGGITIHIHTYAKEPIVSYQKKLYDLLIKHTGLKGNRASPIVRDNFHMLRETLNRQAITIEHGFMDSSTDVPIILSDDFARKAAKAHAEFLITTFGLKRGDNMNVGDKVTIKATATTYTTGEVIADRFKGVPYTIQSLGTSANGRSGSALIKELVSWVRLTDLQPVVIAPPATVLKSEYDIVLAQRDKQKIENDLLKDNIVRLKAEVTYLQGQVKTVSDTLAKEKATTMTQSAEMVHLNQQLATVKDSLASEKIVLSALNTKYNNLDAEYVQLIRVDADNVKKMHGLNSQIELLLINNLNLEKEVERLYAENQSLKQQTYIDWQDATWKQLLKQAIIKWWNE
jgi:N-acetylmuramoyl-L-alanine amidase